jgi:HK97 family phage prohead protease
MDAPRDDLYRARASAPTVADPGEEDGLGLMAGHFAVFDQWTRIESSWEGTFMERFAAGAFNQTIKQGQKAMRVLYDHGHDPQIGNKVLGPIRSLAADDEGAAYGVPLYDTSYNRDLLPGLKDNAYGASFRFRVMKEEWVDHPQRSDHNPDGLPERTVREAWVPEFGPVTFPAYAGASAAVRSLTDRYRGIPDLGTRTPRAADDHDGAAAPHSGMTPEERERVLVLIAQGVPIP